MMAPSLFLKPTKTVSEAMLEFHQTTKRHQCDVMLNILLGGQLAEKWWTRPNRAFSNQTPNNAFEINPDSVVRYLRQHTSGDY